MSAWVIRSRVEFASPSCRVYESVFLDFGGSFLSAQGSDRTITVSGNIADRTGVPLAVRQNFMNLTLSEIRRASAQAAIGWYAYQDYRQECEGVMRSVVSARIGSRLSHIHSVYEQQPTAGLQQYINANNLQNAELVKEHGIGNDTALGIFGGCEMSFSRPIANAAELSFLVDTELANDWIDLEGLQAGGTAHGEFHDRARDQSMNRALHGGHDLLRSDRPAACGSRVTN